MVYADVFDEALIVVKQAAEDSFIEWKERVQSKAPDMSNVCTCAASALSQRATSSHFLNWISPPPPPQHSTPWTLASTCSLKQSPCGASTSSSLLETTLPRTSPTFRYQQQQQQQWPSLLQFPAPISSVLWLRCAALPQTGTEATGIAGVMGNKGGAAISFVYRDATSFAFVSSHLAARYVSFCC